MAKFWPCGGTTIQHPDNISSVGFYNNSAGQLYLDLQGVHGYPSVAGTYSSSAHPVFRRTHLNPPVMLHVQWNCHWCENTYDEVALDALAAYIVASEFPGETVRDRNIRSRAYLDGFEAALICFKNACLSQSRACVASGVHL